MKWMTDIQMADVSLTDLQYQVLSFVSTHPKAGRLAIKNGLADGETFVSEAALRTVLGELSSAGYLIVHRTKGGCEISELQGRGSWNRSGKKNAEAAPKTGDPS